MTLRSCFDSEVKQLINEYVKLFVGTNLVSDYNQRNFSNDGYCVTSVTLLRGQLHF